METVTATAQGRNFTFLQVLRIHNVELWESKLNHYAMLHKGDLQLLYSQPLNMVLLRTSGQNWILEKELQIIGCRRKVGGWQCYCIPSPGGFHLLKITGLQFEGEQHPELINLETVLENFAAFRRVEALQEQFEYFHNVHPTGIDNLKESLTKIVETIEDKFLHSDSANHPNNKIVRPLNDLLAVNTDAVPMVDLNEHQIQGLRGDMEILVRDHQNLSTWNSFWEGKPVDLSAEVSSLDLNASQRQSELSKIENQSFVSERQGEQNTQLLGEVTGKETEKLPSYEVDKNSKDVHTGFKTASTNLGESNVASGSTKEDTAFTTDLMKEDVKPSPVGKDLPKESLNMQAWGSNVTNPSETNPTLDSDIGKTGVRPTGDQRTEKTTESSEKLNLKETAGAI